jgi:UDP-N-acetylglucosamine 4-epimerase
MVKGEPIQINGDGETSRDFCYVTNTVQANLLAAAWLDHPASGEREATAKVFNVALGNRTTLNQLFELLRGQLSDDHHLTAKSILQHAPFREGDVRHSQADIGQIHDLLGYVPTHNLIEGLKESLPWYLTAL